MISLNPVICLTSDIGKFAEELVQAVGYDGEDSSGPEDQSSFAMDRSLLR
jgi:hypothetical protein